MKYLIILLLLISPKILADKGDDFEVMAEAIYFEARNQPLLGQVVVGCVIMNRVISDRYPDDVYGVVWQHKQFSYTHDGKPENMHEYHARVTAAKVASKVLYSDVCWPYQGILHYANLELTRASWPDKMELVMVVGDHSFFIENRRNDK